MIHTKACCVLRGRDRVRRLAVLLALLFTAGATCCVGDNYMRENPVNQPIRPMIPTITVVAEALYVLEYPILIAVILRNETSDTDYLDLPELGLLQPIDSLSVDIQPINGGSRVRLSPTFTFRDQDLFRTELMAGQAKRMLVDLSQFGQPLSSGQYQLKVSIFNGPKVFSSSPPVKVEFIKPSAAEHTEAVRLRRQGLLTNAVDSGSWQPFLTSNWNTVTLSKSVGDQASQQLALHLCLHRAAYGPEPLALFPLDMFRKLRSAVLSAEAAALEYELLVARASMTEREITRSRVLQEWPDLRTRLDQIEKGQGLLTTLRRGYGIEKNPQLPQGRRPYTKVRPR